jgi:hypothetical protein
MKWEYNNKKFQLFKGFKKAYDSIKRESLYNIKFGVTKELIILIKTIRWNSE